MDGCSVLVPDGCSGMVLSGCSVMGLNGEPRVAELPPLPAGGLPSGLSVVVRLGVAVRTLPGMPAAPPAPTAPSPEQGKARQGGQGGICRLYDKLGRPQGSLPPISTHQRVASA